MIGHQFNQLQDVEVAYQDKGFKGMCLDCGLDIYYQKFDYVNERCESCSQ
jgi:uncharacterized protein (DUF983 family)